MSDGEDEKQGQRMRPSWLRAVGCGAGMGIADAVPGVSGGTVLLVAGMLDAYLASLAAVLAWLRRPLEAERWRAAITAMRLLLPLVAAQILCLLAGVMLLVGGKPELGVDAEQARAALAAAKGLLVNPGTAPLIFAAFFGLVLASLPEPWCSRRSSSAWDWLLAAAGAAIAAGMALSPAAAGTPGLALVVCGGALAISVMILPGISGSLALLLMGLYQPIAAAVHDRNLSIIAAFIAGIVIGLAIAVPLLRRLLAVAHDRTMAFLTGLMAGSLMALWPWKTHYFPQAIPLLGPMQPTLPNASWWWPTLIAMVMVIGLTLVLRWLSRSGKPADSRYAANPI